MNFLTFALGFATVTSFASGMKSHHRKIWNQDPKGKTSPIFFSAGTALIGILLYFAIRESGSDVGTAAAVISLSMAGLILTFLIRYLPRFLPWIAGILLLAAVCVR